ncbi:hypothetical protein BaRGS_00015741 [Batillaria attramentaria]|uniref:Uncharacterized protein n=1 Tax=Batillaria attramentaria TaxID=370345 RepID=A0ABD0L189_9CAEN
MSCDCQRDPSRWNGQITIRLQRDAMRFVPSRRLWKAVGASRRNRGTHRLVSAKVDQFLNNRSMEHLTPPCGCLPSTLLTVSGRK